MLQKLPSLERLVRQLQKVPYLASKNIFRVAAHFIGKSDVGTEQFCQALIQAQQAIKLCSVCGNWTEGANVCFICSDPRRSNEIVCVVETWHDLFAVEKSGGYEGVYHVLGGSLCPLDGVGPDALTIDRLVQRVERKEIQELIFATNPTPEGEATASYIASQLTSFSIKISKLASGVPIGSSLEYMDRVTIYKALSGRQPF